MKLTEHKNKRSHFFINENGRWQGEYKAWYSNGQQWEISHWKNGELHGHRKFWHTDGHKCMFTHFRDNKVHGEYKWWNTASELLEHTFYIDGEKIIDFIKDPELYPTTPEEKTMFALKHGSAPFISDGEDE